MHAAAVRRHDDGDCAAISTIQPAHWASDQATCGAIPQRSGQSSIDRSIVNHPARQRQKPLTASTALCLDAALAARAGLAPAVSGLDDQSRACDRRQCQDHANDPGLEDVLHGLGPAHPGTDGQSHRRQQHQRHGEARQVRLHDISLSLGLVCSWIGGRAVSRPRSLALRPRLTAGLPWTILRAKGRTSCLVAP